MLGVWRFRGPANGNDERKQLRRCIAVFQSVKQVCVVIICTSSANVTCDKWKQTSTMGIVVVGTSRYEAEPRTPLIIEYRFFENRSVKRVGLASRCPCFEFWKLDNTTGPGSVTEIVLFQNNGSTIR